MSDAYADYVEVRYQGELLGELVFEEMARARKDPEEARKLRVLAQLERETRELLAPEVEALGRSTRPDPEKLDQARAVGGPMSDAPWADVLKGFEAQIAPLVEEFRKAEALAPPGKEALLQHVTAHEQALLDFAKAETAAPAAGDSLAPIEALLRTSGAR